MISISQSVDKSETNFGSSCQSRSVSNPRFVAEKPSGKFQQLLLPYFEPAQISEIFLVRKRAGLPAQSLTRKRGKHLPIDKRQLSFSFFFATRRLGAK